MLRDSARSWQHCEREVTLDEAALSSANGKEYSVIQDFLAPRDLNLPCSRVERCLEEAGTP